MLMKFNDGTKEGWTVNVGDTPNIMAEIIGDNEKKWQEQSEIQQ